MVKDDGIDTITVTADDGDDIDDPGKAKFKATKSRLPLAVTVTEKQGVGRAKIVSGSDSFDSGDIPMIAGESWHIRLGAIKVKKQYGRIFPASGVTVAPDCSESSRSSNNL